MRIAHLDAFKNGWFMGDFEPSLCRSAVFEVAVHRYPKGAVAVPHIHRVATEYNLIISGRVAIKPRGGGQVGVTMGADGIFVVYPEEALKVEFIEDTVLAIVKTPSVRGDKYEVSA